MDYNQKNQSILRRIKHYYYFNRMVKELNTPQKPKPASTKVSADSGEKRF